MTKPLSTPVEIAAADHLTEAHQGRSVNSLMPSLAASILLLVASAAEAGTVPDPQQSLGYPPGTDGKLVGWSQVVAYFEAVAEASDRVRLFRLGSTTELRPYLLAAVSSPETLRRLDQARAWQRKLHDPRKLVGPEEEQEILQFSKPVVVVTCSIHSSEVASTFMAIELLHELATSTDRRAREILDNTILLLVPSANPDGVDKVREWYVRSVGKPWEGNGMPWLYHRYAGHDTNRDWFLLNLEETRLLTQALYADWFPTLLCDVHQMGTHGPRMFVPPFCDPVNPNVPPRAHLLMGVVGSHMAADLAAAGKRGVVTSAVFDNWWNGGLRTTAARHNIVSLLTEAASARMATPMFVDRRDLSGAARGFPDHRRAANFAEPWAGGWWRLRDILDYQLIAARSLLTVAARYRREFQENLLAMARDALERGRAEPPRGWLVPPDQQEPLAAETMLRALLATGIEVFEARSEFTADGRSFPAGTRILPAAQPFRSHLKDLMEIQVYPPRFNHQGAAEPPYDVSGWTLPLLMGVDTVTIQGPISAPATPLDEIPRPSRDLLREALASPDAAPLPSDAATLPSDAASPCHNGATLGCDAAMSPDAATLSRASALSRDSVILLRGPSLDLFRAINVLLRRGVSVFCTDPPPQGRLGEFLMPADRGSLAALEGLDVTSAFRLERAARPPESQVRPVRPRRIAVYQPWKPSIDEGWTRLVLERFEFPYQTVHNAEVCAGRLIERFETLLIPSVDAATLRSGYLPGETEPDFEGGLGASGAAAIREFVAAGGTLICLEDSSRYAIEELDLPVRNTLEGLGPAEFLGPGSIVWLELAEHPLCGATPARCAAAFDGSLAFELTQRGASDPGVRVAARYASADVLASGWMHRPERIQGKAAIVAIDHGAGRVVLFGFPPHYRAQAYGTFPLLFRALWFNRPETHEAPR